MLGYFESTRAVGLYAAASKLPWALIGFANLWLSVFFPHTAQRLLEDTQAFARDLGRVVTATIVLAAAATVAAFLCAGTLMTTIFGASFAEASVPFALLSGAAALVLLQANFSNVMLAGGDQRDYALLMTMGATIVVALNLALIPLFGTIGAATSTLLGECCLTAFTLRGARRRVGSVPLDSARLLRGAFAVGAMALSMIGARFVGGAIVQISVALPTFLLAAFGLGVFEPRVVRQ
jgi:O-antigen/teichoic acid export membrane protein